MATKWLLKWAPFKLDALGLITVIGAQEVNHSIGRLSRSRITEYLPVVSSFVVANDSIRSAIAGFELYNVTDGIYATDFAGWFTRWLISQDLTYNCTTLLINIDHSTGGQGDSFHLAAILGLAVFFATLGLAGVMCDWWGIANALSLGITVLVRSELLRALRNGVDRQASTAIAQSSTVVKTLCKLQDGRLVTIYAPRGTVTGCLLTQPQPAHPQNYYAVRMIGWVVFFTHAVSINMAALPSQLLAIGILAVSTISTVVKIGSREELIGRKLVIRRLDHHGPDKSMAAFYARLRLNKTEEEAMVAWRLMPQFSNEVWWKKYRDCLTRNESHAFDSWADKRTWLVYESLLSGERRS